MQVDKYLTKQARRSLAEAIGEARGNEVFFIGQLGDDGRVSEVEVHCRGSREAVPALLRVPRCGEAVLHNHPSGELRPSDADLSLASRYGQDGVGFYIVDNRAEAIYVVVEPHLEKREQLDGAQIAALFGPEGGLARQLDSYEVRESQQVMARSVAETINEDGVGLIEAGTGTGKSLAYLVPMATHARLNRVRVAISTGSINLQQQLVKSDIPLARGLVGPVRVALVKGRGNYLCRRKLAHLSRQLDDLAEEEQAFIRQMLEWSAATTDGSKADLQTVPDAELWEMVRSDSDQTLRSRCPFFQECFYYQSRRQAAAADLLVVNHHLLMADLDLKFGTGDFGALPRYEAVVLDEAHHLEDVATSMLATRVTVPGIERLLGRLLPRSPRRLGVLGRLVRRVPADLPAHDSVVERCDGKLREAIQSARDNLPAVVSEIVGLLEEQLGSSDEGRRTYRFPTWLEEMPDGLKPLVDQVESLRGMLGRVSRQLAPLRSLVERLPPAWLDEEIQLLFDLRSCHDRLTATIHALGAVLEEDEQVCRWIDLERSRTGQVRPRFQSSPIDVAPRIRERVFDGMKAVVLTSATLTVDRRFEHIASRIGLVEGTLAEQRLVSKRLESPFDFEDQVFLATPSGFPEPGSDRFIAAVEDMVCRIVEATDGRTFVLCTSYALLKRLHRAASRRLKDYRLLAQGTMERSRLLDEFRSGHRAVLFGTDSFWEGVDVPGRALSCVVITRLPFRVPTEPVQQARAEHIEKRGGDPFMEYAIPQAVIRFRQGFGRLIRNRTDRGVVVVLDSRMMTRRYGRIFLRSLPPVTPHHLPAKELLQRTRRKVGSPP